MKARKRFSKPVKPHWEKVEGLAAYDYYIRADSPGIGMVFISINGQEGGYMLSNYGSSPLPKNWIVA
jgi:hypothetical protein